MHDTSEYATLPNISYVCNRGYGCLHYSPDGKTLGSAMGELVRLLSPESGGHRGLGACHFRGITCFAFSPDGKRVAAAGGDETVTIWNIGEH